MLKLFSLRSLSRATPFLNAISERVSPFFTTLVFVDIAFFPAELLLILITWPMLRLFRRRPFNLFISETVVPKRLATSQRESPLLYPVCRHASFFERWFLRPFRIDIAPGWYFQPLARSDAVFTGKVISCHYGIHRTSVSSGKN